MRRNRTRLPRSEEAPTVPNRAAFLFATLGRIGFEGRYDYGMVGMAVIVASRLSSAAEAGQIPLAPSSNAIVENAVVAEPIGELQLKGMSHPIAAVNVTGLSPAVSLVDA